MPAALKELAAAHNSSGVTMFVVLHPQCTCSRATVHELSRVLAGTHSAPDIYVLLYRPSVLPQGWNENGVLPSLAAGLNAHLVQDMDGRYAAALGASTSGEVLVFSGKDDLLFQGGVTSLRGHEGRSAGSDRLLDALKDQTPFPLAVSVFGCPIFRHT